MEDASRTLLSGEVIDELIDLTLPQLSDACRLTTDQLVCFVEVGLIEPSGRDQACWRFRGTCMQRVRQAARLQRDLGVNEAGAALALELLDEIRELRSRLALDR